MLHAYRQHAAERAALGIPPLPLSAKQTAELIELLKAPPEGEAQSLVDLISHRVPAGVKVLFVGLNEPWGRGHGTGDRIMGSAVQIANAVERCKDLLAETSKLTEHLIDRCRINMGEASQCENPSQIRLNVEREANIP